MSSEPTADKPVDATKKSEQLADTLAFNQVIGDTGDPGAAEFALGPEQPSAGDPGASSARGGSLVGRSFDDIELLEELGRGGMGVVFKARQKSLNRLVAVKLLLAEHLIDEIRLARFQAEARAAASLTHVNIVQVYQIGRCPLGHYFTMEFVDGASLETVLARKRPPVAATVSVILAVADAVHYAHTKGIVHRDLKPANIMIDRTRRPVVMDFGIAKFVGKSSLTQQGVVMGTPAYMAPEQAGEGGEPVGPRSDVYALGAILYTALTGRVPYDEETPLRTILKVISPEMPPSVRRLQHRVPAELDRICMKCLAKKPVDRYPTAQAFAEALRQFRANRKAGATVERKKSGTTMRGDVLPSVILVSRASGKETPLFREKTVIGRASECDIPLKAADVSKRHCQILLKENEAWVEDLDSANGVFVNDQRIKRALLEDGDRLSIADYDFIVCLNFQRP
jgi:serine/threonine protein kinase